MVIQIIYRVSCFELIFRLHCPLHRGFQSRLHCSLHRGFQSWLHRRLHFVLRVQELTLLQPKFSLPLLCQLVVWPRTSREVTALSRKRVAIESSFPPVNWELKRRLPVECSNHSKVEKLSVTIYPYHTYACTLWRNNYKQMLHSVSDRKITKQSGSHYKWSSL